VVLFHITASAEWSSLPLSGLFVEMLQRLTQTAGGTGANSAEALEGTIWNPVQVLDGFGELQTPNLIAGVPGERLAEGVPAPDMPPGFYASGARRAALNVVAADATLAPLPSMPAGVAIEAMDRPGEVAVGPWLLAAALALLALDVLVTLFVSGRLTSAGRTRAVALLAVVLAVVPRAGPVAAQTDEAALYAANETVLAYVLTGNPRVDRISKAGLTGLSHELFDRTAIEPADPVAVDLETDELSLLPILYWPVTESQPQPSDAAYAKLNDYLRYGGMILFDTLDSDLGASFGGATPNGRALQRVALKLDIPPLEPTGS
jgi:hypothetical protein